MAKMHRAAFALLAVFIMAGCTSAPKHDPGYSDFRIHLATENFRLGRSLDAAQINYLQFTKQDYVDRMTKQDASLVRELQEFDEFIFGVSPRSFVVCVKSVKDTIAICDNSTTPQTDRVKPQSDVDLKVLMEQIRGP